MALHHFVMAIGLTTLGASLVLREVAAAAIQRVGLPRDLSSSLTKRQAQVPDDWEPWRLNGDVEAWCNHHFHTAEEAARIWYESNAGALLNYYLEIEYPEPSGKDWLEQYVDKYAKDGEKMDCATVTSSCQVPGKCSDYVKNNSGFAWWTFQHVASMHGMFAAMHEGLVLDGALQTALEANKIVERFPPPEAEIATKELFGMISSAFGAAGTFSAVVPPAAPASGPLAAFGAVFSAIGELLPEAEDPTTLSLADITEGISLWMQKSQTAIQYALWDSLGLRDHEGWQAPGDQRNLSQAGMTDVDYWDTNVARWFSGGKWLRESPSSSLTSAIATGKSNLRLSIIVAILRSQNWWLYRMEDISSDECESLEYPSARYVDGGPHPGCYIISDWHREDRQIPQIQYDEPIMPDSAQIEHIVQTYDGDLHDMYVNAIECAVTGGPSAESPDAATGFDNIVLATMSYMSRCMFPLPIYSASWNDDGWQNPYFLHGYGSEGFTLDGEWQDRGDLPPTTFGPANVS